MTEEEIKQKAIKFSNKKCVKGCSKYYRYGCQDGFIAGIKCGLKQHAHDYLVKTKELTDENNKLLDVINNQDVKIADLEKKVKKLLKRCFEIMTELVEIITELDCDFEIVHTAEQFIKESE